MHFYPIGPERRMDIVVPCVSLSDFPRDYSIAIFFNLFETCIFI